MRLAAHRELPDHTGAPKRVAGVEPAQAQRLQELYQSNATAFVERALGAPLVEVARGLEQMKTLNPYGTNTLPRPKEIDEVVARFSHAVARLPQQLAAMGPTINPDSPQIDWNKLDLPLAMHETSRLVDRYRQAGAPQVGQQVKDALAEIHARTQAPAIVQHVIEPSRRQLGQ